MIGFIGFIIAMLVFMFIVGFITGKNYQQDKDCEKIWNHINAGKAKANSYKHCLEILDEPIESEV